MHALSGEQAGRVGMVVGRSLRRRWSIRCEGLGAGDKSVGVRRGRRRENGRSWGRWGGAGGPLAGDGVRSGCRVSVGEERIVGRLSDGSERGEMKMGLRSVRCGGPCCLRVGG
jgi:hypothetical protein